MADRNTPASFTFEEWRVEFNELAADVGDIGNLGTTNALNGTTDLIEAVNALNAACIQTINGGTNIAVSQVGTVATINLDTIDSNGITFEGATDDDFETTLNVIDPTADRTITLPDEDGTLASQGFSIAVSVALG